MSSLRHLAEIAPIDVWENVRARRIQGAHLTVAIVELAPNAVVPEHAHISEQNGLVIEGQVHWKVGDEERDFGPGGTWRILVNVPHSCTAGPEGAVLVDVFSPIRADWDQMEPAEPTKPVWPAT